MRFGKPTIGEFWYPIWCHAKPLYSI
jgi:hypothetical protein